MKQRILLTVFIAFSAITSCTRVVEKEVIIPAPVEEGKARIRVGIEAPATTRAQADHGSLTPTTDELKIYNYAMFIFNASGMLEASLIQTVATALNSYTPLAYNSTNFPNGLVFTKNGGSTTGQDSNPALDDNGVLTLSAGPKMFFSMVNVPLELLAVQQDYLNNNTLNRQALTNETLKLLEYGTDVNSFSAIVGSFDNYVVSYTNPQQASSTTNNRGFMMTTVGTNGYDERTLAESADETDVTDLSFTVGRAMAKVSLASDLDPNTVGSNTSQPNGALEVLSYKIINNPNIMYIMPNIQNGVLTTPMYYDQSVSVNDYFDSHNSSHEPDGYFVPVSTAATQSFHYCIENANLTPKQGNTTIALIKGVFTPVNLVKSPVDPTPDPTPASKTFYRLWIPEYTDTGDGETKGNRYAEGIYFTEEITQTEIAAWMLTQSGIDPQANVEAVKFEDGICYYRLPLYNKENTMAPYTVRRNSYYMIDVVSVDDSGYPDEDGGLEPIHPEEPLDPQTHLTVNISVDDWTPVNQNGNL